MMEDAACVYYEASGLLFNDEIHEEDGPVWLLGTLYLPSTGHFGTLESKLVYGDTTHLKDIQEDVNSRIWLTYRKNFPPIADSKYTSDQGWGCMLRCGQMVIAEALMRIKLGRVWRWDPTTNSEVYLDIVTLFEDNPDKMYSIHNIALMGSETKVIGEWHGPNTTSRALKKATQQAESSEITIFMAMDMALIVEDIKKECLIGDAWKPLVLFIPLHMGMDEINSIYVPTLKKFFEFPQSLGIIGGKPNHALYFIGYVGDQFIYMDPHKIQQYAKFGDSSEENSKLDETFHCKMALRVDISRIDPSLSICFVCKTENEFDDLCDRIRDMQKDNLSMPFCLYDQRPSFMKDNSDSEGYDMDMVNISDEEFEVLS